MPKSPLRVEGDDPVERTPLVVGDERAPINPALYQNRGDLRRGFDMGVAQVSAGRDFKRALDAELKGNAENFEYYRDRGLRTMEYAQQAPPRVSDLRQIQGVGDGIDYFQGALGQMGATMLPVVGGAILGRALTRSNVGGAVGGFIPSFQMGRNESLSDQYQDPTLAATDVTARRDVANVRGVAEGALNTIVPAGVAATVFRKPAKDAMGRVIRDSVVESATETAQEGAGFAARKYLDPNQQMDPWELANAAVMGAIGGGAVRGGAEAFTHGSDALGTYLQARQQRRMEEITKPKPEAPGPKPPPRDEDGSIDLKAYAEYERQRQTQTVENVAKAGEKAQSTEEFIDLAFFSDPDVRAESVLSPESDPIFGKLSDAEAMAALDDKDILNTVAVQQMAEELVNNERTPDTAKQTVNDLAGQFDSPDAQMAIARLYAEVKRNQQLQDRLDAIEGIIRKSNLQKIPEADVATLAAKLAPLLGSAVDQAPTIARQLLAIAARTPPPATDGTKPEAKFDGTLNDLKELGFATQTGKIPVSTLQALTWVNRSLAEVDPDDLVIQTAKESADRAGLFYALQAIRGLANASQDVMLNNKQSFLYSMMTEEAKNSVTPAVLRKIAEYLDDNAGFDLETKRPQEREQYLAPLVKPLFGTPERAQVVVSHYNALRRAALSKSAPLDNDLPDDRPKDRLYGNKVHDTYDERDVEGEPTVEDELDAFAPSSEGRAPSRNEARRLEDEGMSVDSSSGFTYYFQRADTKPKAKGKTDAARRLLRPFLKVDAATLSNQKQESKAQAYAKRLKGIAGGPADVEVVTMAEYAQDTKADPLQLVADIREDLLNRQARYKEGDTNYDVIEGQLVLLDAVVTPEEALKALANYETVRASNRTDDDGLVVTDDMLADMANYKNAEIAPATQAMRSMLYKRSDISKENKEHIKGYEWKPKPKDNIKELLNRFGLSEEAATEMDAEVRKLLNDSRITFEIEDGNPIALSAVTMWRVMSANSRDRGGKDDVGHEDYVRFMFKEALAGVQARADVVGIKNLPAGTLDNVVLEFPSKDRDKPLRLGRFSWLKALRERRNEYATKLQTNKLEALEKTVLQETANLNQFKKKLDALVKAMEATAPVVDRTRAPITAETNKRFQDRARPEGAAPLETTPFPAFREGLPKVPNFDRSDIEVSPRNPSTRSQTRDAEWRNAVRGFVKVAFDDLLADQALRKKELSSSQVAEKASAERHMSAIRAAQRNVQDLWQEYKIEEQQTSGFPEEDTSTKTRRINELTGQPLSDKKLAGGPAVSTLAQLRESYKGALQGVREATTPAQQAAAQKHLDAMAAKGKQAVATASQNLNAKNRAQMSKDLAALETELESADTKQSVALYKQVQKLKNKIRELTPVKKGAAEHRRERGASKPAPSVTEATEAGRVVRTTDPKKQAELRARGYQETAPGRFEPPNENAPRLGSIQLEALHDVLVKGQLDRLKTPEQIDTYNRMIQLAAVQLAEVPEGQRTQNQKELLAAIKGEKIIRKSNRQAKDIHESLGKKGIPAAHNSRHVFDRFNWRSHFLKGEGSAAFGAGLYLSTAEKTFGYYKRAFSEIYKDDIGEWMFDFGGTNKPLKDQGIAASYMVTINADRENDFFAWDAPVSELPAAVFKKLQNALAEIGQKDFLRDEDLDLTDGRVVYNFILGEVLGGQYKQNLDKIRELGIKVSEGYAAHDAHVKKALTPELSRQQLEVLYKSVHPDVTKPNKWGFKKGDVDWWASGLQRGLKVDNATNAQMQIARKYAEVTGDSAMKAFLAKEKELFTAADDLAIEMRKLQEGNEPAAQIATSDLLQKHGIVGHTVPARFTSGEGDSKNPNFVIYDDSKVEINYVQFNKQGPKHKGRPPAPERTTEQWREEYKAKKTAHDKLKGELDDALRTGNQPEAARLQKEVDKSQKELDRIQKKGQESKTKRWAWQDLMDELITIRGPDIKLRIDRTWGEMGGMSGEYSADVRFAQRLIEIAINAGDPAQIRSVAMHESVHDLFQYIRQNPTEGGRKLLNSIQKAADAPHVIRQLRERLAGDKAALDQLSDSEERAAYMFQFWASDPTFRITPAARNIFQKLAQLIREILGIVSKYEKAELLLAQYQTGKYAMPALQGTEVAARDHAYQKQLLEQYQLTPEVARERLERLTPWLVKGYDVALTDAISRLRSYQYAPLNDIADLFHRHVADGEHGEQGLLQARYQMENMYLNRMYEIVDELKPAQARELQKELNTDRIGPHHAKARQIHALLDELYAYMTADKENPVKRMKKGATNPSDPNSWEPVPFRKDYYPRKWDASKISKEREHVTAMFMRVGYDRAAAEEIVTGLIAGDGRIDVAETERHLGFVPFASGIEARRLTKINDSNIDDFADFLSDDLIDTMSSYIRQIVHRTEYAKRFGNNGEKIIRALDGAPFNDSERKAILKQIQALEGTLGHDLPHRYKSAMGALITTQNLILLPLAVFTMAVDPMGIAIRTGKWGEAGNAYLNALKDLKKFITRDKSRDWGREMADFIGVTSRTSMLEAYGQVQGSMYMTRTFRRANQVFFKWNGMEGLTNSYRVSALEAGTRWVKENLTNKTAMEELGLNPEHVYVLADGRIAVKPSEIYAEIQAKHPGKKHADTQKLADEAARDIAQALFRFVDSAIIRPNAAHRPVWMSDPRFILLAHLKQFATSFHSVILQRVNKETMINGKTAPAAMLMTYMPIMLASDIAKWFITPVATTIPDHWGWSDYVGHSVMRSGILGKGEFGVDIIGDLRRSNLPGESFIGPSAEHAVKLAQWLVGDPRTTTQAIAERTIPGLRYFI